MKLFQSLSQRKSRNANANTSGIIRTDAHVKIETIATNTLCTGQALTTYKRIR